MYRVKQKGQHEHHSYQIVIFEVLL